MNGTTLGGIARFWRDSRRNFARRWMVDGAGTGWAVGPGAGALSSSPCDAGSSGLGPLGFGRLGFGPQGFPVTSSRHGRP